MDITILIIVISVIIVAAVIVVSFVLKQKRRTNKMISDNEYYRKRQESAVLGIGLIVHSNGGVIPQLPSAKVPVALTMEITPGEGTPYRARTRWLVDVTALSYVAQGQEVSVKIDKDNNNKIYPNASWARYISS